MALRLRSSVVIEVLPAKAYAPLSLMALLLSSLTRQLPLKLRARARAPLVWPLHRKVERNRHDQNVPARFPAVCGHAKRVSLPRRWTHCQRLIEREAAAGAERRELVVAMRRSKVRNRLGLDTTSP
jgi:hypothetical protein